MQPSLGMKPKNLAAAAVIAGLTALASFFGGRASRNRAGKLWYRFLRKPRQTPPDAAFGVVWPALYGLSALSGYRAWTYRDAPGGKAALALWGAQTAFNGAWSPLFFGQRRTRPALGVLAGNFATLAAYAAKVGRHDRLAAVLVAPYLAWLAFAGTVNFGIVTRNPKWLAR